MTPNNQKTDSVTSGPVASMPHQDKGPANRAHFRSILFPPGLEGERREHGNQPACFVDLNLDQVVAGIVVHRDEEFLRPLFYSTYRNEDIIRHRQAVFGDLDRTDVFPLFPEFCEGIRKVRLDLNYAEKITYKCHRQLVLLRAIALYCNTVASLRRRLELLNLQSLGLQGLREYLVDYASSESFVVLVAETHDMQSQLSPINYAMLLRGSKVTVRKYASEPDYTKTILERFARFREEDVEGIGVSRSKDDYSLNHIEEEILELVGQLFPHQFCKLREYVARHSKFVDDTIALFDREIRFFLAYLAYIAPFKRKDLPFCYPDISASDKNTAVSSSFDLALAAKLVKGKGSVVLNDFHLSGSERMIVVSGPNQGGKTTFARMFGQLHFLAGLGCPVPGQQARLFLVDRVFTHFEREEDITNLRGKLEEELVRLRESCRTLTPNSVIILNEIFNSTSLEDQLFLSTKVLEEILATDALGICVTFIDVLASLNEKTVSMMSTVVSDDPAQRTFQIIRKPADGLAYALSLAEKRGVTYERLRTRIRA